MHSIMKKERDSYHVSLKLVLKNNKNEILGLKAVGWGSFAHFYDLPGGRIDTDEFNTPFAEVIKREASEEIGNVDFHLHSKPIAIGRHLIPASMASEKREIHILYVFFEADYISGDIKISDEHTGYQWINIKENDPKKYFTSGILEGILAYDAS